MINMSVKHTSTTSSEELRNIVRDAKIITTCKQKDCFELETVQNEIVPDIKLTVEMSKNAAETNRSNTSSWTIDSSLSPSKLLMDTPLPVKDYYTGANCTLSGGNETNSNINQTGRHKQCPVGLAPNTQSNTCTDEDGEDLCYGFACGEYLVRKPLITEDSQDLTDERGKSKTTILNSFLSSDSGQSVERRIHHHQSPSWIFDDAGYTWDVNKAEFYPEILGDAIQVHLKKIMSTNKSASMTSLGMMTSLSSNMGDPDNVISMSTFDA